MKSLAVCAASFGHSVRIASGVKPVTSPPLMLDAFLDGLLDGYDFYYFKLHGLKDQPYWYGDGWLTAIASETIVKANMAGAVVFVANCFLPDSPMLWALLQTGARAVIGGPGENYARPNTVDGADLLGMWMRRGLQLGMSVRDAFNMARGRVRLIRNSKVREDTLEFRIWYPTVHTGAQHA